MLHETWRIELLGGLRAICGDRIVTRFRTRKTASLLAYLAYYRERSHARDTLVELFWPEDALDSARNSLRVSLTSLRRQLEPPTVPSGSVFVTDYACVQLRPAAVRTDIMEFQDLLGRMGAEDNNSRSAERLCRAVSLYRGELLAGYYDDWILAERERLADLYLGALRQIVRSRVQADDLHGALDYARRAVQADPLREESHRTIIVLEKAVGRPAAALEQFRALEAVLRAELGAAPSPATRALVKDLVDAASCRPRPSALPRIAMAEAPPRPEPLAEPPKGVCVGHAVPEPTLPPAFTRFFGRENETARLIEMLAPVSDGPSPCRFVTLTGPGGVGKSRLAIEAARRLVERFEGGVRFVPLRDITDARHIGNAVLKAVRPAGPASADPLADIAQALGSRPALLVLDNMEQLAGGAASVLLSLLNRAPAIVCLATSRRSLEVPGGREMPVHPLRVPDGENRPADLAMVESVQLFVDRAQAVRPDFQVTARNAAAVAQLCRALEGLPLAVELAAARARALAPAQILDRLRARFDALGGNGPRRAVDQSPHRSLRAALEWSYGLLPPDLRHFYPRLSVFRGGWSLEAAEAVCLGPPSGVARPDGWPEAPLDPPLDNAGAPGDRALDCLEQLRSHSLLQVEEGAPNVRFSMFETLREFAAQQLPPEDAATTARRHAAFFCETALAARSALAGPGQTQAVRQLDAESGNWRAALAWYRSHPQEAEAGLRMAEALWRYWWIRGHFNEGREWLDGFLDAGGDGQPSRCRGDALNEAGVLAFAQNDYETARAYFERTLAVRRAIGDRKGVTQALGNLGNIALACEDYAAARACIAECLTAFREIEDKQGIGSALGNLALVELYTGHLAAARDCTDQSLRVRSEIGDEWGVANCYLMRAITCLHADDPEGATDDLAECLRRFRSLNDRRMIANVIERTAQAAAMQGGLERCAHLLGAADALRESVAAPLPPLDRQDYDRAANRAREGLGASEFMRQWTHGRGLPCDQAVAIAMDSLAVGPELLDATSGDL